MRHRAIAKTTWWMTLSFLILLPLAVLVVQAVSRQWFYPQVIPREWTLDAVTDLLASARLRQNMQTGLGVSCAVTVVAIICALPAARALAFGRTRRPALWLTAFLVPTLLPPLAVAMGLNVAFLRMGIAGSPVAVVVAHLVVAIPYAVIIMTGALTRVDTAYERQARLLGASPIRALLTVFLPLARPALAVTAAIVFVVSWGQYLLTLLPGGGAVQTPTIDAVNAASGGNPAVSAAVALVTTLPPAFAILLVVRHLTRFDSSLPVRR